ncbi:MULTISPECIES: hypothetical protein [unclassified Nocardioides]|nr:MULTISPECIES: hypothetical protein [unclassified Nocardioides]
MTITGASMSTANSSDAGAHSEADDEVSRDGITIGSHIVLGVN